MPNVGDLRSGRKPSEAHSLPTARRTASLTTNSPIERKLWEAASASSDPPLLVSNLKSPDDFLLSFRPFPVEGASRGDILVVPQFPMGRKRIDFAVSIYDPLDITMPSRGRAVVFVECDGHAYHERTKEQAARDRSRDRQLQRTAPVMRFTGSEIWNDAEQCWADIVSLLRDHRLDTINQYVAARVDALFFALNDDDSLSQMASILAMHGLHPGANSGLTRKELEAFGISPSDIPTIARELAPYFKITVDTIGRMHVRPLAKWVHPDWRNYMTGGDCQ